MDYSKTLTQILQDMMNESDDVFTATDEKLISDDVGQDQEQYTNRNNLYTSLLESYIDVYTQKAKRNKTYKCIFFYAIMTILVGVIVSSVVALIIAVANLSSETVWAIVSVSISSMAGMVSSIIVLPKIIANHLFPSNEDENMIGMVQSMQDNDSKIRDVINYKNKPT